MSAVPGQLRAYARQARAPGWVITRYSGAPPQMAAARRPGRLHPGLTQRGETARSTTCSGQACAGPG